MTLKAILFDVDGTLVDSNDLHARAWQDAFRHFGVDHPFDVVRSQIGKGGDLLVPDLLNARQMREFGKELKEYRSDLFKKKYMESVTPFDGVADDVKALHDRGLTIVLASSANPDEVDFFTNLLGIGEFLEGKTSKKDAEMSKPSPEIFEAALGEAGCDASEALVVGDTPYDILAAHRAGIAIAAVRCGGFDANLLAKAEFLFQNVAELVRRIDEVDGYFGK